MDIDNIEHPTARNVLNLMEVKDGGDYSLRGSSPFRCWLSSTFSVGLLHALAALKENHGGQGCELAAICGTDLNKEHVGCQDQLAVAHGGFNRISPSDVPCVPYNRQNRG